MRMVMLTILEARFVLEILEGADYDAWAIEDKDRAIEIMEESLHNTQEIKIPDGKTGDVPARGDTNT